VARSIVALIQIPLIGLGGLQTNQKTLFLCRIFHNRFDY
ncbi:MAG: hypothetical protein RLZZ604_914, partial [Pseudomonadota bacterium]